jgi:ParB family chromosome partitioning protein
MATAVQKMTLSSSRDIPFNKLILSQSNVHKIKAGVSVEELADDIARRGLLQGINLRPVLDEDGAETGIFEVPAGGRRYQALALLVKQKVWPKARRCPALFEIPRPPFSVRAMGVLKAGIFRDWFKRHPGAPTVGGPRSDVPEWRR